MRYLSEYIPGLGSDRVHNDHPVEIRSVTYDSRTVEDGSAFCCLKGEQFDGHQFIRAAIAAGASSVIGSEPKLLRQLATEFAHVVFALHDDPRSAMCRLAESLHGGWASTLRTAAITGTNGKTTVTAYVRSLLNAAGVRAGSIGTNGIWDDQTEVDLPHSTHTTPEAPDLHRSLEAFSNAGLRAAAVEVTSIGIVQQRIENMRFEVGVYTNLSPEHLDFHQNFDSYKEAKLRLLEHVDTAVVNLEDRELSEAVIQRFAGEVTTYGLTDQADVCAHPLAVSETGTHIRLRIKDDTYQVHVPVFGAHNLSNLLAAVSVCLHMGLPHTTIVAGLSRIQGAPGRFELANIGAHFRLIMDYAHNPDGLRSVIDAAHQMQYRRFILLFTGVGLRDPHQRPQMAAVAEGMADEIVVSVDHPGPHDKHEILAEVMRGFTEPHARHIHPIPDRPEAVREALSLTGPGDLVLLTGLGHGGYQVIADQRVPYCEAQIINDHLKGADTPQLKTSQ